MHYEYKVIDMSLDSVEVFLNQYAKQGWEYVNTIPKSYSTGGGAYEFKVVFRRQKK